MIAILLLAAASCLPVAPTTDKITAGDLAPALPALEGMDTAVALAPLPGVPRLFTISELRRVAARLNAQAEPSGELCFLRPVAPLDRNQLMDAMRKELPQASIEILDFSRAPAPQGELEFPLRGLRRAAETGMWSGSVRYAGSRRFLVWAKVRISEERMRVIAVQDLQSGKIIRESQLRIETRQEFPSVVRFAGSLEEVAGKVARLPIRAGAGIRSDWVEGAKDVTRGETVKVEVRSGAAHLELEAEAETAGSAGSLVSVRNPISGKRFPARVEGKGRVSAGRGPS